LFVVIVKHDWSIYLQWQSRRPKGLPPERSKHICWRRVPVWTPHGATQAVYRQVCR